MLIQSQWFQETALPGCFMSNEHLFLIDKYSMHTFVIDASAVYILWWHYQNKSQANWAYFMVIEWIGFHLVAL